jgi:phosphatidylglycerophosphate synthase
VRLCRAGCEPPWGFGGCVSYPPIELVIANALTAVRLLLAVPFAALMARPDAWSAALAGLALAAAVATDVLDGMIARRRGTVTPSSGLFDHTVDCLFVTAGLAAAAGRDAVPWMLPVLVALAFAQYVADSYWVQGGRALRASALGRWNGMLYFVPLVGDVLARLGVAACRPIVTALAWILVVSTIVSMGDRLIAFRRAWRTARGSRDAGTASPPPR